MLVVLSLQFGDVLYPYFVGWSKSVYTVTVYQEFEKMRCPKTRLVPVYYKKISQVLACTCMLKVRFL